MNPKILEARRKMTRDLTCVRPLPVLLCAAFCLLFGILCAVGGIDKEKCEFLLFPKTLLPRFFLFFFSGLSLLLFGAAQGILLCVPDKRGGRHKTGVMLLMASTPILFYAWTPVTFTVNRFFLSVLLILASLPAVAALFSDAMRSCRAAAYCFFAYGVWMLYLLYLSFGLLILN